jgi:hypothetical protein
MIRIQTAVGKADDIRQIASEGSHSPICEACSWWRTEATTTAESTESHVIVCTRTRDATIFGDADAGSVSSGAGPGAKIIVCHVSGLTSV